MQLVRVVDGDSVIITIDQGFKTWRLSETFRLWGVDAPEIPMTLTGGDSDLNESFSLTNDDPPFTVTGVQASDGHAAAETVPASWDQTSAACDDGSPIGNIDVSVGETATCTSTDSLQTGCARDPQGSQACCC